MTSSESSECVRPRTWPISWRSTGSRRKYGSKKASPPSLRRGCGASSSSQNSELSKMTLDGVATAKAPPGPSNTKSLAAVRSSHEMVSRTPASAAASSMSSPSASTAAGAAGANETPVAAVHTSRASWIADSVLSRGSDAGIVAVRTLYVTTSPRKQSSFSPGSASSAERPLLSSARFVFGPATPSSFRPRRFWAALITFSMLSTASASPSKAFKAATSSSSSSSSLPSAAWMDVSMLSNFGPRSMGAWSAVASMAWAPLPLCQMTKTRSLHFAGRMRFARRAAVMSTYSSYGSRCKQFGHAFVSKKNTPADPAKPVSGAINSRGVAANPGAVHSADESVT
mmetsp:Transcript_15708/g.52928  ORF Transcript_15708/g.52928 Transcript_15708/m.52928 type:complete len:341 (-) Transcript_15708:713-1735(-)